MTSRASVSSGIISDAPIRLRRRDNRGVPIRVAANWINPVRTVAVHWILHIKTAHRFIEGPYIGNVNIKSCRGEIYFYTAKLLII